MQLKNQMTNQQYDRIQKQQLQTQYTIRQNEGNFEVCFDEFRQEMRQMCELGSFSNLEVLLSTLKNRLSTVLEKKINEQGEEKQILRRNCDIL